MGHNALCAHPNGFGVVLWNPDWEASWWCGELRLGSTACFSQRCGSGLTSEVGLDFFHGPLSPTSAGPSSAERSPGQHQLMLERRFNSINADSVDGIAEETQAVVEPLAVGWDGTAWAVHRCGSVGCNWGRLGRCAGGTGLWLLACAGHLESVLLCSCIRAHVTVHHRGVCAVHIYPLYSGGDVSSCSGVAGV